MNVTKLCTAAFGIVLNVVGAFIALNLRLPIYVDSIGTILSASLYGPVYGIVTGVFGSLVSGITFDIYSIYFAPVQICTGLMAGLLFRTKWLKKGRVFLGAFVLSLPTSIGSAIVNAFVFGGITSSGSSYVVQILTKTGMDLTLSCFLVQVLTDYIDKLVAVLLITAVLAALTPDMRERLKGKKLG